MGITISPGSWGRASNRCTSGQKQQRPAVAATNPQNSETDSIGLARVQMIVSPPERDGGRESTRAQMVAELRKEMSGAPQDQHR